MNVLITHETSGRVRDAFRARGHTAFSCDLLPDENNSPFHWVGDAVEAINYRHWDFIGMHPSCQFLTVAGIHWNKRGRGEEGTKLALAHVRECMKAATEQASKWYLENPVSIISTQVRKPDQIIQPYEFGEDASKKTCLWLNNLPLLIKDHSNFKRGRLVVSNGKEVYRWNNQTDSGQNRLGPSNDRWKERSRTYPGIANAMASQWGN